MGRTEGNRGALQPKTLVEPMQGKGMHGAGAGDSNGTGTQRKVAEGYIMAAYGKGQGGAEFSVCGTGYKALEKEAVTTFYDAGGNTLFSLENRLLDRMRRELAGDAAHKDAQKGAEEKLRKERDAAKGKGVAGAVLNHLIGRCREDAGLAQDVMQEHKTWVECFKHIHAKAMGQAEGGYAYVPDEVVFGWAEGYYRRDDKAGEGKKAPSKKAKAQKAVEGQGGEREGELPAPTAPRVQDRPEGEAMAGGDGKGKGMEGQLDLFSMMGI